MAAADFREPVMSESKQTVHEILDRLPDDATLEQIEYQIHVRRMIERGLLDVEEGRVVSSEEAEQRMNEWIEKFNGPKSR